MQKIKMTRLSIALAPLLAIFLSCWLIQIPACQSALIELEQGYWLGKLGVTTALIAVSYWWIDLSYRLGLLCDLVIPKSIKPIPAVFSWLAGIGFLVFIVFAIAHAQILYFLTLVLMTLFIVILSEAKNPSQERERIKFFAPLRMTVAQLGIADASLLALIALYSIPKWIESFLPNGQGDPLYYHAYSAWQWSQAGGYKFDPWFPWFLQGGIMEYMFSAFGVILKNPLALLIASQIFHATVSILFGGIVVYQLSQLFVRRRVFSLLAVLAFLTIARDPLVVIRAKNDGFIAIFCLAACYGFFKYIRTKNAHWLLIVTIFSAMALLTKHTALFVLIPLACILCFYLSWYRRKSDAKSLFLFTIATLPFGVLILLRNFVEAGSPVFPAMTHLSFFHSPFINDEIAANAARFVGTNLAFWPEFLMAFKSYALSKPFFIFSFFSLFLIHKKLNRLLLILTFAIMAITAQLAGGDPISDRFAIALLGLFAVTGAALLSEIDDYLQNKKFQVARLPIFLIALCAALYNSGVEIPISRFVRRTLPFTFNQQTFFSYIASERPLLVLTDWINEHYTSGRILSTFSGEGLLLKIPIINYDSEIRANTLMHASNIDDFIHGMKDHGFTLFLKLNDGNAFEHHRSFYPDLETRLKLVRSYEEFRLYELL